MGERVRSLTTEGLRTEAAGSCSSARSEYPGQAGGARRSPPACPGLLVPDQLRDVPAAGRRAYTGRCSDATIRDLDRTDGLERKLAMSLAESMKDTLLFNTRRGELGAAPLAPEIARRRLRGQPGLAVVLLQGRCDSSPHLRVGRVVAGSPWARAAARRPDEARSRGSFAGWTAHTREVRHFPFRWSPACAGTGRGRAACRQPGGHGIRRARPDVRRREPRVSHGSSGG